MSLAQLKVVVCDDSDKALQLMNSKSNLEYVIVIDNLNEDAKNKAKELNIKILTFEELKKIGKNNMKPVVVS